MYARRRPKKIIGLEIVPEMVDMASRSVAMNDLSDRIEIVEGDIKNAFNLFEKGTFDVVLSQPTIYKSRNGQCEL